MDLMKMEKELSPEHRARRDAEFLEQLRYAVNYCSREMGLNLPDFVIAQFLFDSLKALERGLQRNAELKEPDEWEPTQPPK